MSHFIFVLTLLHTCYSKSQKKSLMLGFVSFALVTSPEKSKCIYVYIYIHIYIYNTSYITHKYIGRGCIIFTS